MVSSQLQSSKLVVRSVLHYSKVGHPNQQLWFRGGWCKRQQRAKRQVLPSFIGDGGFMAVTPERGFLPASDPLIRLHGTHFDDWEEAVADVPKWIVASGSGQIHKWLEGLPEFPLDDLFKLVHLSGESQQGGMMWRAYMIMSFLAHAYVWGDAAVVPKRLPAVIAVPWVEVARKLQVPPVLIYASYNLFNWRRLDPEGPIALGNIACCNNFFGGMDEEWFRLVHVNIEAQAAKAVAGVPQGQAAAALRDGSAVSTCLGDIHDALVHMQKTLDRMGEKCDPYIYFKRVRLPMSGWRNNAALPHGLVYEGVSGTPLQFYGETGAQSSIVPTFDAALGITHTSLVEPWLGEYLEIMEQHMPPQHRKFIYSIRRGPSIRDYITQHAPQLKTEYNDVVHQLDNFRAQHSGFAFNYIAKFSAKEKGTGGSDFMPALKQYIKSTASHALM